MTNKQELRRQTLVDRGVKQVDAGRGKDLVDDIQDKTPQMLFIEGKLGKKITEVLMMPMSNRVLARYISDETGKSISQYAIHTWRKQFGICRVRA